MILTILRILYLRLRNNPLELMLVFIMPVVFFSIFAAIFSNGIATGGDKKLRIGWIAERETALGNELLKCLEANSTLQCFPLITEPWSAEAVDDLHAEPIVHLTVDSTIAEAQKSGRYDLIIRLPASFPARLSEKEEANTCEVRLVTDGQNPMAVAMVTSVVKGFFAQTKATLVAQRLLSLNSGSQLASGIRGSGNGDPAKNDLLDPARGTTSLKGTRNFDPVTGPLQIFRIKPESPWATTEADAMASANESFGAVKELPVFPTTTDQTTGDYFDSMFSQNSNVFHDLGQDDLTSDGLFDDTATDAPSFEGARYFDTQPVSLQIFGNDRDGPWLTTDADDVNYLNGITRTNNERSMVPSTIGLANRHYFDPAFSQNSVGFCRLGDGERAIDGLFDGSNMGSHSLQEQPSKSDQSTTDHFDSIQSRARVSKIDEEVIINVENPQSAVQENPRIAMYAAGIAVLFLLFSSTGNAAALLEEAESGTLDRIMIGKAGLFHIIGGKWLGIFLLGCIQICVMFLWAELVFKIQLWKHLGGFLVMTLSTAAATSSFAMLMATLCRSRAQLNAASVVLILSMSAVGGSMIPRFAMSDRMKEVGKWTFNAWALDGYQKVFWFQSPISSLQTEVTVLLASALVFGGLALIFSLRWKCA